MRALYKKGLYGYLLDGRVEGPFREAEHDAAQFPKA